MATPKRNSTEPRVDRSAPAREAGGRGERHAHAGHEPPAPPRRNYRLAITMALIVFALLIGVRVLWTSFGGSTAPTLPPVETTQPAPAPAN